MIDKEGSSGDFVKDLQNKDLKVRQVSFSVVDVNDMIKKKKMRDQLATHAFFGLFEQEIREEEKQRKEFLQKKIKEARNR